MKINAITFEELQRPAYILDETKLRSNLSLIAKIAKEADIEIILAFKAYALWKTFPIFREYMVEVALFQAHPKFLPSPPSRVIP